MDIRSIGELSNVLNNTTSEKVTTVNDDFKQLLDKITGGNLAKEISQKYNVTLGVGSVMNYQQLLDTYNIRCTNYVQISPETLEKMEQNKGLKQRILSKIEEFCSAEEQAKTMALSPPVKSSGMIVYPDGRCLYWIEGYPNEIESNKLTTGEKSLNNLIQEHSIQNQNIVENNYTALMQVMATSYKRR